MPADEDRLAAGGDHPSVLGRLPGKSGGRSLLIYAHLDTVPTGDPAEWVYPPFSATIAEDKIWGRGAKDCKLGLAAALMATRLLQRAGLELDGDLQIVAPADEEMGGQLGIAQMIEQGMLKADWAIYGEGTPDQITIGHRGMLNVLVTTTRPSAQTLHESPFHCDMSMLSAAEEMNLTPSAPRGRNKKKRRAGDFIAGRRLLRSVAGNLRLRYVFFCDIRSAAIMKLSNRFSATANHSTCSVRNFCHGP